MSPSLKARSSSGPNNRLFVYGSLAPGGSNYRRVISLKGVWRKASVRGDLVRILFGPEAGYTGLVAGRRNVHGWLVCSRFLGPQIGRLDRFEGEHFQRKLVPVWCKGRCSRAYAYYYQGPPVAGKYCGGLRVRRLPLGRRRPLEP